MAAHEIADARVIHEGRRSLVALTVALPGGKSMVREVLESPPAAAVLPYDERRRTVLLVRQFRAAALRAGGAPEPVEAIAGLVDPGETPEACIRREAMEEAGLRLGPLEPVGSVWASPGYSTERVHLFLAPYADADRTGEGGGLAEEQEDIATCEIEFAALAAMLAQGALEDMKTLALAQALALRVPALGGALR
ncbi:NUDIX domain-containing protein [Microvirga thermotolerans]|uniref:GDP-mannose pyrophosphatase n=1 Tax=Microvirga thermotolerans TaxID=2651334 RepID=A0A5P9K1H5_9HYPH|nr:NUDIX domain-containing protein [Microvirga thermotolerans]QFU17908.1 NUDIX domain-containing protein [Microvirga thermotolerans]